MHSWWETPLCSEFLEEIRHAIEDGNIALVFLPKHTPDNFLSQFRSVYDRERDVAFEKINLMECDIKNNRPVESLLFNHFDLEDNTDTFISKRAASIFEHLEDGIEEDSESKEVFVFENLTKMFLVHFRNFLMDLGHYMAGLQIYERPKIIVKLEPENFGESDFTSESGISKILFKGIFDKLDYSLGLRYYHNYRADDFTLLNEKIITSLALFDTRLADELIICDNIIDDYPSILEDYAKSHKWENLKFIEADKLTQMELWDRWSKGILEVKNDKVFYHSAYLKIQDKGAEIHNRIWLPCVEVLIPLIEEFRIKVLGCNQFVFPRSYYNPKTSQRLKDDKMDFEIGEIDYMIKKSEIRLRWISYSEKNRMIRFIDLCRKIRNQLSHLSMPLTSDIKLFIGEYNDINNLLVNND